MSRSSVTSGKPAAVSQPALAMRVPRTQTTIHTVARHSILMGRLHSDKAPRRSSTTNDRLVPVFSDNLGSKQNMFRPSERRNIRVVPESLVRTTNVVQDTPANDEEEVEVVRNSHEMDDQLCESKGAPPRELEMTDMSASRHSRKSSGSNHSSSSNSITANHGLNLDSGERSPVPQRHSSRMLNSELFDDGMHGRSVPSVVRHGSSSLDEGPETQSADVPLGAFGRMRAQGRIAAVSNFAVISAATGMHLKPTGCCILQPNGSFRRKWDIVMIFLLGYLTVFTPFQIAFLHQWTLDTVEDWWFIFALDRFVDVYFVVDIVLNFRTAIPREKKRAYFKCSYVGLKYLKSWFFVDLLSSIPFEFVEYFYRIISPEDFAQNSFFNNENSVWFKINKIIRLVRLAKLLKVVRASRVLNRWERVIVMKVRYGLVRLILFLIIVIVIVHWLGCCMGFLLVVQEERDNWLLTTPTPIDVSDTGALYVACVYWAVTTVTTIGYGDIAPTTTAERVFVMASMFVGAAVFSYVIGTVCIIAQGLSIETEEFQSKMDALNQFMQKYKIPQHLRVRANDFCFYAHSSKYSMSDSMREKVSNLVFSPPLMSEIAYFIHGPILSKLAMFRETHREFLAELSKDLQNRLFGPHEYVYNVKTVIENMFILYSGSLQIERWDEKVVQVEQTLVAPSVFGEQFVLFDRPAARSALTLTFCEVAILQRVNFIRALRMFPECLAPVRAFAIKHMWFGFFRALRAATIFELRDIQHSWDNLHPEISVAGDGTWRTRSGTMVPSASRQHAFTVHRSDSLPPRFGVSGDSSTMRRAETATPIVPTPAMRSKGRVNSSMDPSMYNLSNPLVTRAAASKSQRRLSNEYDELSAASAASSPGKIDGHEDADLAKQPSARTPTETKHASGTQGAAPKTAGEGKMHQSTVAESKISARAPTTHTTSGHGREHEGERSPRGEDGESNGASSDITSYDGETGRHTPSLGFTPGPGALLGFPGQQAPLASADGQFSLASMLLLNKFAGQNAHPTNESAAINLLNLHEDLIQMRTQQSALFQMLGGIQNMLLNLQQTQQAQHLQSQLQLQQQQQPFGGQSTNAAQTPQTIHRPEPKRLEALQQNPGSPNDAATTGGASGGGGGGGGAVAASDKKDSELPPGQQVTPKRLQRKKARVPKTEEVTAE